MLLILCLPQRSGAARALTELVASRELLAQDLEAKALWDRADELAKLFQRRFVAHKG